MYRVTAQRSDLPLLVGVAPWLTGVVVAGSVCVCVCVFRVLYKCDSFICHLQKQFRRPGLIFAAAGLPTGHPRLSCICLT